MPACSPASPPSPTPYELLQQAAQAVASLTGNDSAQHVTSCFQAYRWRLWCVVELLPDTSTGELAWAMVTRFAQADLEAYLRGEELALSRLQNKVAESLTLLP